MLIARDANSHCHSLPVTLSGMINRMNTLPQTSRRFCNVVHFHAQLVLHKTTCILSSYGMAHTKRLVCSQSFKFLRVSAHIILAPLHDMVSVKEKQLSFLTYVQCNKPLQKANNIPSSVTPGSNEHLPQNLS